MAPQQQQAPAQQKTAAQHLAQTNEAVWLQLGALSEMMGELDGATPPEIVRDTAALIPGARFEVLPSAGHLPGVEVAPAYAALLTRFLEELG